MLGSFPIIFFFVSIRFLGTSLLVDCGAKEGTQSDGKKEYKREEGLAG